MDKKEVLIEVKDLKKYFQVGRNQTLKAVDGVNFKIYKGETLGIVGESGCGKTTCGKTVMGLYKATGGEVLFDGVDINKLNLKYIHHPHRKIKLCFGRFTSGHIQFQTFSFNIFKFFFQSAL